MNQKQMERLEQIIRELNQYIHLSAEDNIALVDTLVAARDLLKEINAELQEKKKITIFSWIKRLFKREISENTLRKGIENLKQKSFQELAILRESTIGFDHVPTYEKEIAECQICKVNKECVVIFDSNQENSFFICETCLNLTLIDYNPSYTGPVSGDLIPGVKSPYEFLKDKMK